MHKARRIAHLKLGTVRNLEMIILFCFVEGIIKKKFFFFVKLIFFFKEAWREKRERERLKVMKNK